MVFIDASQMTTPSGGAVMRLARNLLNYLILLCLVVAAYFISYNYMLNDFGSVGVLKKRNYAARSVPALIPLMS